MKHLLLILAAILFVGCSGSDKEAADGGKLENKDQSQVDENGIPEAVTKACQEKFPNAESVEWEKEGNIYEAEFMLDGKEYEAEYDAEGNWLATEWEIKISDLPDAVIKSIEKNYPDWEIEEAEEMESEAYGNIFEVEIEKDDIEKEVFIDKDGKILGEEEDDGEDENGDDND